MTARFTVGMALVVMQLTLYALGTSKTWWPIAISLAYFASTLTTGIFGNPRFIGSSFNGSWMRLVGMDVLAFFALQFMQGGNINYTPLLALPILLASILGTLQLALGTAAGATLCLLLGTLWYYFDHSSDIAMHLAQAALSGVGYFAISILANQLAHRLTVEGMRARQSQAAVLLEQQVNTLVIAAFTDGVLIVDNQDRVRSANPAARNLLNIAANFPLENLDIQAHAGWWPLLQLAQHTLATGVGQEKEISIAHAPLGSQRIRVKTHITAPKELGSTNLCVLFLQDQRELEARVRTEKLASMGRMSAAVAHEIRNPLATITQANALLEEELSDPKHTKFTRMVDQNAKRLAKIVDDILSTSSAVAQENQKKSYVTSLNAAVGEFCQAWGTHNACQNRLLLQLSADEFSVRFDSDHLQRILVNLLDNAKRYTDLQPEAIQVQTQRLSAESAILRIWSKAAPMEKTVEKHLFEPFFSSDSRSNGLGLYICRELCIAHGASIQFQRNSRHVNGQPFEGNEFSILLLCSSTRAHPQPQHDPTRT
jgi:two-component system sensor histidine kinase PilS (NtrC family)